MRIECKGRASHDRTRLPNPCGIPLIEGLIRSAPQHRSPLGRLLGAGELHSELRARGVREMDILDSPEALTQTSCISRHQRLASWASARR